MSENLCQSHACAENRLCRQCLDDLRLGRMVRKMGLGEVLWTNPDEPKPWCYGILGDNGPWFRGDTPEEAIRQGLEVKP